MKCIVPSCSNRKNRNWGVSFHNFPKDPKRRKQWEDALDLKESPISRRHVCSQHFKKNDVIRLAQRTYLMPEAVPFLHLDATDDNLNSKEPKSMKQTQSFENGIESSTNSAMDKEDTLEDLKDESVENSEIYNVVIPASSFSAQFVNFLDFDHKYEEVTDNESEPGDNSLPDNASEELIEKQELLESSEIDSFQHNTIECDPFQDLSEKETNIEVPRESSKRKARLKSKINYLTEYLVQLRSKTKALHQTIRRRDKSISKFKTILKNFEGKNNTGKKIKELLESGRGMNANTNTTIDDLDDLL